VATDGTYGIQIVLNDLTGHSRLLAPLGRDPRAPGDGTWVYYRLVVGAVGLWRIHPDGSGMEQVLAGGTYPFADPTADGTQVAYGRVHAYDGEFDIVVRTVATGDERTVALDARLPRWSPTGDRIAFWRQEYVPNLVGEIWVADADGSGARMVSPAGRSYGLEGLDWSPDGEWLVARSDSSVDFIGLATGLVIPVTSTPAGSRLVAWRR
jgi:hypothetical protein